MDSKLEKKFVADVEEKKELSRHKRVWSFRLIVFIVIIGAFLSLVPLLFALYIFPAIIICGLGFYRIYVKAMVGWPIERNIFLKLCRTLQSLDLHFDNPSKLHLNKAERNLRDVTLCVLPSEGDASLELKSSVLYRKMRAPLQNLRRTLTRRILPLVRQGKNLTKVYSKLENLALIYGYNLRLEEISKFNDSLKSFREVKRAPLYKKYIDILKKPARIIFSLAAGQFLVTSVIGIYSLFLGESFVDIVRTNLIAVVSAGVVLSAALIWARK